MQPAAFALLRRLATGRLVPAGGTGLSRAALRAAAEELAAHGLQVLDSAQGVRLAEPFDALDAGEVLRLLGPAAAGLGVEILDECESTNLVLAEREPAVSGTVIACELQTAGRGRRGARWHSGLGDALTFSLLWRPSVGSVLGGGLPLVAGVACARALESLGAKDVALKWPNDLLLGAAKLGGILVEAQSMGEGASEAVIGIGLNVRMPGPVRTAIGTPVADLTDAGFRGSRNAVLAAVLAALDTALQRFEQAGFAAFRDEWTRRHAWHGRAVRLLVPPARTVEGVVAGIADDGALLVETGGGLERFHAAEVRPGRAA
jgi:BirA family biotin operon repressor/biotin-[acetyl-CoA-carboxylase] ligase